MRRRDLLKAIVGVATVPLFVKQSQATPPVGITPCTTPTALTAATASTNVQLKSCGDVVIVFNNSSQDAFFKVGATSGTTAVVTDNPLPSKTFVTLNVGFGAPYFAAITAANTATIQFIQGQAQ